MKKRIVKNEQYFTDSNVVSQCLGVLSKHCELHSFDLIIEPSAGDGSFSCQLPREKLIAIDIAPMNESIIQADYLKWIAPTSNNTLTIGNPPFGARGSLAMRFMNRACVDSTVVAMILPCSFRKYTFINRINPHFHLIDEMPCSGFHLPNGEKYPVNCVFQVWKRMPTKRAKIVFNKSHVDFEAKHFHLSRTDSETLQKAKSYYEFAIAQVGVNFMPKDVSAITKGSYWFIYGRNEMVRKIFETLDFSFLDGQNTVFKSLSICDIVKAYETAKEKFLQNSESVR